MNSLLFRKFLFVLIACISATGCVAYADPVQNPSYGCTVVADEYGEREVCNTYYYETDNGAVYWDPYFSIWVGGGGYWRGGIWYYGYYPGYADRYHGLYHSHGFYGGLGHHGFGYHGGGGYHGGWRSGGGYHGGFHGGRGHR